MALIYYCPKLIVDPATGRPAVGLKGAVGKIVARGDTATSPEIYEDAAGSAIIAGSELTVTDDTFVRSFYVDEAFGPVSFWGAGVEAPLETTEGLAILLAEYRAATDAHLDDVEATAADAVTAAQAAQTAAEAAQAAAEALEAGTADWSQIQNKPPTFPPDAHTHAAADTTSGTFAPARLGGGTPSGSTFLRGDGQWATPPSGGPGGGAVTSVANKTGDVSLVKADVGLPNVDNTSDVGKPISAATQAALNGKAATSHTHVIGNTTGLQAALDSKRGLNDQFDASLVTSGVFAPARMGTGAVGNSEFFLASDGVYRQPSSGGSSLARLNEVVCIGDSNIAAADWDTAKFHELLEAELNITAVTIGVPGSLAGHAAVTSGARTATVALSGGAVPTTGSVAPTAINPVRALYGDNDAVYGSIGGVRVQVTGAQMDSGVGSVAFVRQTPGSAVSILAGTAFMPEGAGEVVGRAAVVWTGTNDLQNGVGATEIVDALVAIDRRMGGRAIFLTPVRMSSSTALHAVEDEMVERLGSERVLNVREFLSTYGPAWTGVAFSGTDSTDISSGYYPSSYLNDTWHLKATIRPAVVKRAAQMLVSRAEIQPGTGGGPSDTTPPTTPTGVAASAVTQTSFTVSWAASTDNTAVTAYDVYLGGSFYGSTASTSLAVTGRTAGFTYAVTVRARDAAGNQSGASSSVSVTTQASSDTVPPSTPTGLASSGVTSSGATITWTASTDNVAVTGYQVRVNGTTVASPTVSTQALTGLIPGTSNAVEVRARDAAGNWSAWSATLTVPTPAGTGNLVAQWILDEGTGTTAANEVAGQPTMSFVGSSPAWATPGVDGNTAAFSSAAQGDAVRCSASPEMFPQSTTAFSITMKVRPKSMPSGNLHLMAYAQGKMFLVCESNVLKVGFQNTTGGSQVIAGGNPGFVVDTEYTLAVVYGGGTVKAYVDGVEVVSGSVGVWSGNDAPSGRFEVPWSEWAPGIAHYNDVRVYSTALTSGEIAAL